MEQLVEQCNELRLSISDLRSRFIIQRWHARFRRNIEWKLSFKEWLSIWLESGKLKQRGKGIGKFHMCRVKDQGAYENNNVYIDSHVNNSKHCKPVMIDGISYASHDDAMKHLGLSRHALYKRLKNI